MIHSLFTGLPEAVRVQRKAMPYRVVPEGSPTVKTPLPGNDAPVQLPPPICSATATGMGARKVTATVLVIAGVGVGVGEVMPFWPPPPQSAAIMIRPAGSRA